MIAGDTLDIVAGYTEIVQLTIVEQRRFSPDSVCW